MKGKLTLRFNMPNVQRFRSRVEKPSADLSKIIRTTLNEVIGDVLNENILSIRAKMIQKVDELGLEYKSAQHKAKVMSVLEPFFDAVFAATEEKLVEITGETVEETDAEEQAEPEATEKKTDAEEQAEPEATEKKTDEDFD